MNFINSTKWLKHTKLAMLAALCLFMASSFADIVNTESSPTTTQNNSTKLEIDVSINGEKVIELPDVIKNLEDRGVEIVGELSSLGGIKAYAGIAKQQPLAVYLTPDEKHIIIGTMLNEQGEDVTHNALEEATVSVWTKQTWEALEQSSWVHDGSPEAERVVYMFTDPNCPFCNKFWLQARPWVESGSVQLRHILVGTLTETSEGKAAAILASEDPQTALQDHELSIKEGGIDILENISEETAQKLERNTNLMAELLISGTPGILYFDSNNLLQIQRGAPLDENLIEILGPEVKN